MFPFNSLFNVDQTSAPGSETTERLRRKLSGKVREGHKWIATVNPVTPFQGREQADRWARPVWMGDKIRRAQAPWASHVSCMTAFHRRGQLEREARSCLCEVPTDKYCWNVMEYFLTLWRHHNTKQALDERVSIMWNCSGELSDPLPEEQLDNVAVIYFTPNKGCITHEKTVFSPTRYKSLHGGNNCWRRHVDIIRATLQPVFSALQQQQIAITKWGRKRVIMSTHSSVFRRFPLSTVNFHEWQAAQHLLHYLQREYNVPLNPTTVKARAPKTCYNRRWRHLFGNWRRWKWVQ